MKNDNKNLYLAIGLSILVILGWNYFYGWPQMQRARQAQQQQQAQVAPGAPPVAGITGAASPTITNGQDAGDPQSGRPRSGAVARTGPCGRPAHSARHAQPVRLDRAERRPAIDDVSLKNYRTTTDPNSPIIELPLAFGFAASVLRRDRLSWVSRAPTSPLPGPDTVWTADADKMTTDKPLTLTWNNGQGLTFKRAITVDDQYMFVVKDSVDNAGTAPVTLFPLFARLPPRQARDLQLRRAARGPHRRRRR